MTRPGTHQSTPIVAADWTLSAGMGSTATKTVSSGSSDLSGLLTITSSGTGQSPGATAALTFRDGAFPLVPFAVCSRGNAGNQVTVPFLVSTSTTQLILTFGGTPVAGEIYYVFWILAGGG